MVPYAPGGPTDVVARSVGAELEKGWKQPFIVENRPGGLLGKEYVARQSPDGYTPLLQGGVPFTVKLFMKAIKLPAAVGGFFD